MDISSCEGMGLASFIIKKNPKMPCLVTDIYAHLVKNLRLFVNRELTEYNINFSSFDNFDMPIIDNSLDYITSIDGISDIGSGSAISGNELQFLHLTAGKEKAINEVYRILKPGGYFITFERYVEWTFDLPKIYEECNLHGKLLGEFTYEEIIDVQQKLKSPTWRDKFLEAGFEIEIEEKISDETTVEMTRSFLYLISDCYRLTEEEKKTAYISLEKCRRETDKTGEDFGIERIEGNIFYVIRKPN
jgi:ubiquinone/menaquinone biosynthesis C-methylase UbiE